MFRRIFQSTAARVAVLAISMLASGAFAVQRFLAPAVVTSSEYLKIPTAKEKEVGQPEKDDPRTRQLWNRKWHGPQTVASRSQLLDTTRREIRKWRSTLPSGPKGFASALTGLSWVNLGPADASFEWNGQVFSEVDAAPNGTEPAVDSGRLSAIAVDPTNDSIVYVATSGGGAWKTYNYSYTGYPDWIPLTETIGDLAIGSLDLCATNPQLLAIGTGDQLDGEDTPQLIGQIFVSNDAGATWSAGASLSGTYPASAGGLAVTALNVRSVRFDPDNPTVVLAGTDVGLFRSSDGGNTFALVDLPNAGPKQLAESIWSIVYTGSVGGVSRWVASGVYACDQGDLPPEAGGGTTPILKAPFGTTFTCPLGNPGDIWVSTDAGATWSSELTANKLPPTVVGEIVLGAGTPSTDNPPKTAIYGQTNAENEGAPQGVGIWRSLDSGATWVDSTGSLPNPTLDGSCNTVNVGLGQGWFDSTVAVDPGNNDQVIIGGQLCSVRTLSGTQTQPVWENAAYWLPEPPQYGTTRFGTLPYVHADYHASKIIRTNTGKFGYRAFFGTDGGLFGSENVFYPGSPSDRIVNWSDRANHGLVTHLVYSVGSGDPTTGNPYVVFASTQDNALRFRNNDPAMSTTFDQVVGGDATAAAVGKGTSGTIYWGSLPGVEGGRYYCNPAATNCDAGGNWIGNDPALTCPGDGSPFVVRVSPVQSEPSGTTFITITDEGVYLATGLTPRWSLISPCMATVNACESGECITRGFYASQTIPGLYGVALSDGRYWVTSGCSGGNCNWTLSNRVWIDLNGDGIAENNELVRYTSSISFPPAPPTGGTSQPGDVYVAATVAVVMDDPVGDYLGSPVPPAFGHLFITRDRGKTWQTLHGNGTGFDLPNVPIEVVRHDPSDLTGNTIYVGTWVGLYQTTDGGNTWYRYGYGLPAVEVDDLYIALNGSLLRVATFGRGIWEIYPNTMAPSGVKGNGDFDRNLHIDYIDLAALTARMGATPATTTQPYYDWNLDLVGSVDAIDESDLTAQLTRFGDTP
jgi:hypothetical protein